MRPRYLTLTVSPEQDGAEVNTLLRRGLGLSGTLLRRIKWLEDGILLDGTRVNTRVRAQAGQVLSVRLTDPERKSGILPRQGPLDIVYEDRDLIVLNKAAGVPVHPGPGHYDDTLGNFLIDYYNLTGEPADFHPVHRLDRGTTGLIVAAKHAYAQEKLKNQLHTGGFCRRYLAVCDGVPAPAQGVIDAPLGPEDGSLIRRRVRPDGAPARTHYRVLSVTAGRALVELELDTGRTHQIRVHMAHIGCPLTGDFLYGTEDKNLIARPALHSVSFKLRTPLLKGIGLYSAHTEGYAGTALEGGAPMRKLQLIALAMEAAALLVQGCNKLAVPLPDWTLRMSGIAMLAGIAVIVFASVRLNLKKEK